ncbi:MAG: formylglycine-generating enzyme family protein [Polyangiales bacterium]
MSAACHSRQAKESPTPITAAPETTDAGRLQVIDPSCAHDLKCGTGTSCCDRKSIPGGRFVRGRKLKGSNACPAWARFQCGSVELPAHEVAVRDFEIDTFEVTVGRFREYLRSQAGADEPCRGDSEAKGQRAGLSCGPGATWSASAKDAESLPMNCVDQATAQAFCAWSGGRLPTEDEWEYAAAGGDEERLFPWGSASPQEHFQYVEYGSIEPKPVGRFDDGRSRWGQYDMAGNLAEWTSDHVRAVLEDSGAPVPNDCEAPLAVEGNMVRGGSSSSLPACFRAVVRQLVPSTMRADWIGFRCVRAAP